MVSTFQSKGATKVSQKVTEFPNSVEKKLLEDIITILKQSKIKFTKQKFERGIKLYVKHDYTRVTFHLYNVSDGGRG